MVHTVALLGPHVHRPVAEITLLTPASTRVGYPSKRGPFSPQNIPSFSGGNSPKRAKKPATESPFVQGQQECPNSLRSELKPPSRLEPAF